jgi:Zn-dependent M32 family carboxypeptidase
VIEKRGTGGGAFRLLYSRFLAEAAILDPDLTRIAPADEMKAIAAAWTELALALKEASEAENPAALLRTARQLADLADREETFFRSLRDKLEESG